LRKTRRKENEREEIGKGIDKIFYGEKIDKGEC